jgi:ribosomal protein S18 acetylase RimI-like enzyme
MDRAAAAPRTLSAWENNRARALYERLGFVEIRREGRAA